MQECENQKRITAVAIGDFDGMHRAHNIVCTGAEQVIIYCVHNRFSLLQKSIFQRRYPTAVFADFDAIRNMEGRQFVEDVLIGRFGAGMVLCGFNFRFGKNAAWDAMRLRAYLEDRGIWVRILEHQDYQGVPISSTRIRAAVQAGEMEQAAAMLVRVYEKYHAPTTWKHAFYALSSYSQLEQAKQFDAVSFGWSHMTYSAEEGAKLSTVKDDSSGFYIPAGYADVVPALREAGVELKLNVFMSGSSLRAMLNDGRAPMVAVAEILAELERVYPDLGYNPYSGVTIDFEGLRAADKESFNAFMTELSAALHAEGKTLYAAVMPAVYGDAYFDGYDFRTLSTLCDRVILMAHDYAASDLTGFLGSRYYRNHPCAPLYKVYYAVRTAAREMDDPAKLTLAVSMDARAWQTDVDGLLTAVRSTHPLQTTVYKRLCQSDTVMGWSDTARSPWCTYTTESGQHIFLWYEDARSTAEKLSCARLVGVTSVSVWRLGLIPDYADEGLHYDVMSVL